MSVTTAAAPRTRAAAPAFRPDIQGLRAIAVGVVLLYHAGFPFLPGGYVGVDVFFVISGFLITGILLREIRNTGRLSLAGFYAKRARRILPAATVVLVATVLLTWLFLPEIRWQGIGIETVGAALYFVNWIFAANTDYLNAEVAASPLQHFWTLSVEEQFYIVWPLVLIVILLCIRRVRDPEKRRSVTAWSVRGGVILMFLPSFLWSLSYTASDPAPAYFVTTTRLWELAIGAIVAVFAAQLERTPAWLGYALGWLGVLGIIAASLFYTAATPFPGSAALLPTLSSAAAIVGGMGGRASRGAGAFLALRPMRWMGDISYSLYLWHWPIVVVATYLLGGQLRFRYGLIVIIVSIVLAWLSYRFVENPFRNWERLKRRARASLMPALALVAASVLAGGALYAVPAVQAAEAPSAETAAGAAALVDDPAAGEPVDTVPGGFTPSALEAREDNPIIYANGCHAEEEVSKGNSCTFGDERGTVTVWLVGDSHAASWEPAVAALAEQNDWRLFVSTKAACPFADVDPARGNGTYYDECHAWNDDVLQQVEASKPDLVITANSIEREVWRGGMLSVDESVEPLAAGMNNRWRTLNQMGIPVAVIRDTPKVDIDVPECVSSHPRNLTACAVSRSTALDDRPDTESLALEGLSQTAAIDMNRWICPAESCVPVIGNVLIWRDGQHLTATYAKTLAPLLGDAFKQTSIVSAALFGRE